MQHIKSYMDKINAIIDGSKTMSKKNAMPQDNDKSLKVIASYVKGIREARKGLSNGK
jgi:hypothetical protein